MMDGSKIGVASPIPIISLFVIFVFSDSAVACLTVVEDGSMDDTTDGDIVVEIIKEEVFCLEIITAGFSVGGSVSSSLEESFRISVTGFIDNGGFEVLVGSVGLGLGLGLGLTLLMPFLLPVLNDDGSFCGCPLYLLKSGLLVELALAG